MKEKKPFVSTSTPETIEALLPFIGWCVRGKENDLSPVRGLGRLMRSAFRLFFFDIVLLPDDRDSVAESVLFFKSHPREDYDVLFENVAGAAEGAAVITTSYRDVFADRVNAYTPLAARHLLSRAAFSLVSFFRRRRLILRATKEYGWINGLWLYVQLLKVEVALICILDKLPEAVVVFGDMNDMDRVLSWLCRKRGIPCATMQHGIYTEYLNEHTVNNNNYRPRYCTDFLAWGEMTARLVSRYVPDVTISICGKPAMPVIPELDDRPVLYDCLVIFDQNLFKCQNVRMLDIVRESFGEESRLAVRLHPQNNPDEYDLTGFHVVAHEGGSRSEVYVGHATTFLLELLAAGLRLYRYNSGAESAIRTPEIEFQTASGLKELLDAEAYCTAGTIEEYYARTGEEAVQAHLNAIKAMVERQKV